MEFLKNEKEKIAEITSADEENRPGLIVFDLNNANAKPLTLIPKLENEAEEEHLHHRVPLAPAGAT